MLNADLEISTHLNARPEQKLLSAVVALAIKDSMLPPYKPSGSKHLRMTEEAHSAFDFLLTDACESYLEWLDVNPVNFRRRLLKMMEDRSNRDTPFAPIQRRAFRLNKLIWQSIRDAA